MSFFGNNVVKPVTTAGGAPAALARKPQIPPGVYTVKLSKTENVVSKGGNFGLTFTFDLENSPVPAVTTVRKSIYAGKAIKFSSSFVKHLLALNGIQMSPEEVSAFGMDHLTADKYTALFGTRYTATVEKKTFTGTDGNQVETVEITNLANA